MNTSPTVPHIDFSEDELLHAAHAVNQAIDYTQAQPDYPGKAVELQILHELIKKYKAMWEQATDRQASTAIPDIHQVGAQKPVGYASAYDFRLAWTTAHQQIEQAQAKGLKTRLVQPWEGEYVGETVFVYDKAALQYIIDSNLETIKSYDWPITASEFVESVIFELAPSGTALYDIVSAAFGETDQQAEKF